MQLGSIELQIFVALILVLGSAFVALVCDFLKGNNEQLRERNIELRVRQDERERLGLFEPLTHPITWLQGLAALARNPALVEKVAPAGATPAAAAPGNLADVPSASAAFTATEEPSVEPASTVPGAADLTGADRNPQRRHRYDEFKAASKGQTWATKEELEQLAGRAARIRARHEASQKKPGMPGGVSDTQPAAEVHAPEMTAEAALSRLEPKPELLKPARATAPAAAPIDFPFRASKTAEESSAQPAPAITPMEVIAGLPPISSFETARPESVSPSAITAEPFPSQSAEPEPPLASKPAPAPWKFRPISEDRPRAIEVPLAAAAPSMGILKPDAPTLVPTLSQTLAPVEVAEEVETASSPVLEDTPVAPRIAALQPDETLSVLAQPEIQVAPEQFEAAALPEVRTRILPVDVPAIAEASTEDIPAAAEAVEPVQAAVPAWRIPIDELPEPADFEQQEPEIPLWKQNPQGPPSGIAIDIEEDLHIPVSSASRPPQVVEAAAPPPPMPAIEARPADTNLPGFDVAALHKATGSSRPAPSSLAPGISESETKLELPPGLHESAVLSQLLENQTPFSGVVVAIGLNDFDSLREKLSSGNDSVAALSRMVLSMLRAQDFACRFQDDEYILIYPGERGSSAQRRLFQVSEKLWDFQLRSLGNLSVMFSWGGLEVTNETLAEAVASARERMYQTKRNRKPASLDLSAGRKKVVNG